MSGSWDQVPCGCILTVEKRFLRKGVGVYIQYGQPARGLERGLIKVSNSIYSARNIRDQWPVVYFDCV